MDPRDGLIYLSIFHRPGTSQGEPSEKRRFFNPIPSPRAAVHSRLRVEGEGFCFV
jgi:hypothetical protein